MEKIAYFDSSHDMPEEVISAAGYTPYKILGDVHESNDAADQYLSNIFCPAARSWLTHALSHSKEWAGIVFAQGCNATNRHHDVWKLHVDTPFLYWFNKPMKDDEPARKFYKHELEKMVNTFDKNLKSTISKDDLKKAIYESNEIKKRLQTLSTLRSSKDVTNKEYIETIIKTLQADKKESIKDLEEVIDIWNAKDNFPADKKKFLLTGSDVTYSEFMELLDDCDIRIVRDDLSTGERYFAHLIPDNDDPYDALIEYYMNIPRPATWPTIEKRLEYLFQILDETEVDGILSQNLKFCEPYAYDSVLVNETLKEKGHKVFHLEREFTPMKDQQLANRVMAFAEML